MHFTANNTSLAQNKLENKSNNLSIIKESDELPPNQTQESIKKKHQNNTSKKPTGHLALFIEIMLKWFQHHLFLAFYIFNAYINIIHVKCKKDKIHP